MRGAGGLDNADLDCVLLADRDGDSDCDADSVSEAESDAELVAVRDREIAELPVGDGVAPAEAMLAAGAAVVVPFPAPNTVNTWAPSRARTSPPNTRARGMAETADLTTPKCFRGWHDIEIARAQKYARAR